MDEEEEEEEICHSRRQQNWNDKYLLFLYSVEILLMMDSGLVRNMYSTLSYKCEK